MTGKQYFIKVANAIKSMESLEQKIRDLKECATLIGSFEYDKVRVQTSPKNYQEERIIKILDSVSDYDKQIAIYAALVLEAEQRLATMSRTEYADVIRIRHLQKNRLSWDEMGDILGYTGEGLRTVYRFALDEFEGKYLKK